MYNYPKFVSKKLKFVSNKSLTLDGVSNNLNTQVSNNLNTQVSNNLHTQVSNNLNNSSV